MKKAISILIVLLTILSLTPRFSAASFAEGKEYRITFVFQDAEKTCVCKEGEIPRSPLAFDEGPFNGAYQLFDRFEPELSAAKKDASYTVLTSPAKPDETLFFSLSCVCVPEKSEAAVSVYAGCAFDAFSLRLLYDDTYLIFKEAKPFVNGMRYENGALIYEGSRQEKGKIAELIFSLTDRSVARTSVDLLPTVFLNGKRLPVAVKEGAVIRAGVLAGDLDGSGSLDDADAALLLRTLSGSGQSYDLNGDGICSLLDLTALIGCCAGMPQPLYDPSFKGKQNVRYRCSVGGEIAGQSDQSLSFAEKGSAVSAKPIDEFYSFCGWSDGCPTLRRSDAGLCSGGEYLALFELGTPDFLLPKIEIKTDWGMWIMSKTDYIGATFTMTGAEEGYNFSELRTEIRGRGNSTWDYFRYMKPSYKLRLEEKAALLPGKGAERDWVLLTTITDKSMLRNWASLKLGTFFSNVSFVSGCRFVEVTINGDYLGVYLLCEQVEVSKKRINIDDSVEGGQKDLLFALDARAQSPAVNIPGGQHPFEIKSTVTKDDIREIRKYLKKADEVIKTGVRKDIEGYFNVDSFVDMFILEELTKDRDVGYASLYFVRKNGVISVTAPWDFDLAWGNDEEYPDYDVLLNDILPNDWFKALYAQDWFKELVSSRWRELRPYIDAVNAEIGVMGELLKDGADRTYKRFDVLGERIFMEPREIARITTYKGHVDWFRNWYNLRADWLEETFTGK